MSPTPRRILIAGASGVVGQAALAHFEGLPDTEVLALSRRPPKLQSARHLAADLADANVVDALAALPPVTHLIYAALYEAPGLLEGWRSQEQMTRNDTMLRHCLAGLASHPLEHVSLLQGTKAYGAHIHPMRIPGLERRPRDPHENFYWLQEDRLRAEAAARGFAFTLWRPPVIFGPSVGAPMDVLTTLGVYGALCAALDAPFAFPGGVCGPMDGVDATLLAEAFAWALDAPAARNQTFNVSNGDVFQWDHLWPDLTAALGLRPGAPDPRALATWLPQHAALWHQLRADHALASPDLATLVGDSPIYADMLFGLGRDRAPPPTQLSTIALRQAGFAACRDSEIMLITQLRTLAQARVLPPWPLSA
ncbi:MAG: NAD-dependent epimerase/dehydratase family protein [Pseudomonadales bacterium]|nr:NAD-dependent epimerase/dehydratase family protein [Pseudomonadales bacterium]